MLLLPALLLRWWLLILRRWLRPRHIQHYDGGSAGVTGGMEVVGGGVDRGMKGARPENRQEVQGYYNIGRGEVSTNRRQT